MEKNNLFEGAKLGDHYKTRDGNDAYFIRKYVTSDCYELVLNKDTNDPVFYLYYANGMYWDKEDNADIVEKCESPVDKAIKWLENELNGDNIEGCRDSVKLIESLKETMK